MITLTLIILLGSQLSHPLEPSVALEVGVARETLENYYDFFEEQGGDPLDITDFSSPLANRAIVDIVMIYQALHQSEFNGELTFVIMPNPARALAAVESGFIHMYAHAVPGTSFNARLLKSNALIEEGESFFLLYALADNERFLSIDDPEKIKQYDAVVVSSWLDIIDILERTGIEHPILVNQKTQIVPMLQAGRGDFTVLSPTAVILNDAAGDNIKLRNLEGYKIIAPTSRHYAVSPQFKESDSLLKALNRGIATLRSNDVLPRVYIESGFLSDKYGEYVDLMDTLIQD
jgi:hypothetical protein